ncbi:MAG: ComEC/Rec2 family competence protein, partial [Puniceicoccaceae bacterium]
EVRDLFNARKPGRICGTGQILRTDLPFDTISGRKTAFYLESDAPFPPGSRFECKAVLTYLPSLDDPDGYILYLKNRDIFLNLNRGIVLRKTGPPSRLERFRQVLFRKSQSLLGTGSDSPDDPGHVLASMLLGNRSLLTDDRISLYRLTGTYHLFAVSGLHVGSVALCLHWLGGLLRLPGMVRLATVLSITWSYVWLTGSSSSAVRAGIMISCIGLSRQVSRQPHLFPALVTSAWIVLIWQPRQLFSLGFQLSYAVVGAILQMGLPVARIFRQMLKDRKKVRGREPTLKSLTRRTISSLADLTLVSLAAGLASMPLIVQHFSLLTPAGPVLGVVLNPLATYCVMAGSITLLAGLPTSLHAGWIAVVAWPAIRLMETVLQQAIAVPEAFSQRNWEWPPTGTFLLLSALGLAWFLQHLRQIGKGWGALAHFLPHVLIIVGLSYTKVQT